MKVYRLTADIDRKYAQIHSHLKDMVWVDLKMEEKEKMF